MLTTFPYVVAHRGNQTAGAGREVGGTFVLQLKKMGISTRLEYMWKWIHWRYQCALKDKKKGEITVDRITVENIRKDFMEEVALSAILEEQQDFNRRRWCEGQCLEGE